MTTNSGKDDKQQELFFITESFSLSWDPGRAPKMTDKSLQCSTIFIASEGEDLTLGPKTVSVTRALCSINFVKGIMAEKNFLHRYQKRVERLSALLVLSRKFYTFLPAAQNRKKYLKAVKILPRPFPITYILGWHQRKTSQKKGSTQSSRLWAQTFSRNTHSDLKKGMSLNKTYCCLQGLCV